MADFVIFGANTAGAKKCDELSRAGRVLCFTDFDRAKIGTTFHGWPVVHPASLLDLRFDRIALTLADAAGALSFLLRLGVALERIETAPEGAACLEVADMRPSAIIFGARIAGLRTLRHVDARFRVLCFCDGDTGLQGRQLAGRLVVAPADLCVLRYDRIFIGTAETYRAVHDLLWYWNVPIEKMDVVPESILLPPAPPLAGGRPRYIIFGAGSSGERVFRHLSGTAEIVAFVDNNHARHGAEFCGRPVRAPDELATLEYDRIVIGSMYVAEILGQLTMLGVDTARIVMLDPEIVLGHHSDAKGSGGFWRRLLRRA